MARFQSFRMPMRRVYGRWWPLAASWMLMGVELPAVSAVIARLVEPEVNLAAYGGVVFPLSLIIESPIIMLLAASTALSKDWHSYLKLRRFMWAAGLGLSSLHLLVAATPLYGLVVEGILSVPPEVVAPARAGLLIMTPWTASIAFRRFNQGVLIRYDEARAVSVGTLVRLTALGTVLALGYLYGSLPGIMVGPSAVAAGVISEAAYIKRRVRPVLARQLRSAPEADPPLTYREFARFYVPLSLTSLFTLLINPLESAAMSRMPSALSSLAVWPVVNGLLFLLRSVGLAYQEVVVALLEEPNAWFGLRRFAWMLGAAVTVVLGLVAATPLSSFWFETLSGLKPELAGLGRLGLWIGFLLPALSVFQNWLQGILVHSKRTRGITEAVIVFLVAAAGSLVAGIVWGEFTGLYVGVAAFLVGAMAQVLWLWVRSRPALTELQSEGGRATLEPAEVQAD